MKKTFLPLLIIFSISLLTLSCSAIDNNDCRDAFNNKNYAAAKKSCSALVKKNPQDNVARLYLAKTYALTKNLDLALSECKKIYETEKDSDLGKTAKELENRINIIQMIAVSRQKRSHRSIRDITKGALSCKESKDLSRLDCILPCEGKLIINLKNQTFLLSYPDGETIEEHENGTYTTTKGSNKIISNGLILPEKNFRKSCNTEKDGSIHIVRNNGSQEYLYKDGRRREILSSGQTLLYKKDGSIEILKPPSR